jgi:hypothetical protein
MKFQRNIYLIVASLLLFVCAIVVYFFARPVLFITAMGRVIEERQQAVLYHIDHSALAQTTREFAWPSNSLSLTERFPQSNFEKGDSRIPPSLWIADAERIQGYDNRVDFEYGGALLHFGISVFKPGEEGEGTLSLQDGVWFYSDNNRYPEK